MSTSRKTTMRELSERHGRRRLFLGVGSLALVLCVGTALALSSLGGETPAVDHRTSEDLGVSGAVEVAGGQGLRGIVPDVEQEILQMLLVDGSVVARTPRGVVGIDPRGGTERWRYLVSGSEVAVSPLGGDGSVLVVYEEEGLFRDRVHEVVLESGTGEIEHSATFPAPDTAGGVRELAELGLSGTRVVVGDAIVGYRRDGGEERWRVDPGAYCGGEDLPREDFEVASDHTGVYLSVLCAADSQVHLVALDPSRGAPDWQRTFDAGEREDPPRIALVASGDFHGTSPGPVVQALGGRWGSDYLYVQRGGVYTPALFDIASMNAYFPPPADDEGRAPGTFVVGDRDTVEVRVIHQVSTVLVDEGVVSVEDFPEDLLVEEEDGSVRLTGDLGLLSALAARNELLEVLAQAGA